MAKDVKVATLLMGDDGTPRKVAKVVNGIDRLYEISFTGHESEPLVVTGNHILCLKASSSLDDDDSINIKKGEIIEMTVEEYLALQPIVQRLLRLYRASSIPFNTECTPDKMLVDPYFLGLWLGDGMHLSEDKENIRTDHGKKNPLLDDLRSLQLIPPAGERLKGPEVGMKHIPDIYKFASEETRLQVLAGLLDSDGCHNDDRRIVYVFTQSDRLWHKRLFEDTVFLARSLGFSCCPINLEDVGEKEILGGRMCETGNTLRLQIFGDINKIPGETQPKNGARENNDCCRLAHT